MEEPQDAAERARYLYAVRVWGSHPVCLCLDVASVTMLIHVLLYAREDFPAGAQQIINDVIDEGLTRMEELDKALGAILGRGW